MVLVYLLGRGKGNETMALGFVYIFFFLLYLDITHFFSEEGENG